MPVFLSGPCLRKDLLNWMLATSCQQGHLDVVRLLVLSYEADVRDCAIHSDEFAVITGLPLYAAARAGREESCVNNLTVFSKRYLISIAHPSCMFQPSSLMYCQLKGSFVLLFLLTMLYFIL